VHRQPHGLGSSCSRSSGNAQRVVQRCNLAVSPIAYSQLYHTRRARSLASVTALRSRPHAMRVVPIDCRCIALSTEHCCTEWEPKLDFYSIPCDKCGRANTPGIHRRRRASAAAAAPHIECATSNGRCPETSLVHATRRRCPVWRHRTLCFVVPVGGIVSPLAAAAASLSLSSAARASRRLRSSSMETPWSASR
jgi:hypothetical protein